MMWLGVDNLIVHAPFSGHLVEVGEDLQAQGQPVNFGDPTG